MNVAPHNPRRHGHTLMELVAAMVASAMLMSGLASVVLIARQTAYAPTAANQRTLAAEVVNQIADDLRYATLIIQQTPQILEFVVADRNNDGTSEKIRYEWSGVVGSPLLKSINGGTSAAVLDSVDAFAVAFQLKPLVTSYTTTTDSAEVTLAWPSGSYTAERVISATQFSAHWINPFTFPSVPANALYWNLTKVEFYGRQSGTATETLLVQLRPTGEPNDGPSSNVLGQMSVPESTITSGTSPSWNSVILTNPVRELAFNRKYDVAFASASGSAARLAVADIAGGMALLDSDDAGASWQYKTDRMMFCRFFGTYTTPGSTYNVTRNLVTQVGVTLQSSSQTHGRIDSSIPVHNTPELLSSYWRTDFDRNPTTTNANGDSVADWALASGTFDTASLINGVWYASGALETRPLADFTTTTTVEVKCRNTSVGGNGAVVRINADRQGGQYAPILVYLQRQSDGSQTLTLLGRTSDSATKLLFSRPRLASGFVRYRLTILPQSNVVNLQINDEDQGTFSYPTYAPVSTTDRFMTLYADTSFAEFDYADVRVSTN